MLLVVLELFVPLLIVVPPVVLLFTVLLLVVVLLFVVVFPEVPLLIVVPPVVLLVELPVVEFPPVLVALVRSSTCVSMVMVLLGYKLYSVAMSVLSDIPSALPSELPEPYPVLALRARTKAVMRPAKANRPNKPKSKGEQQVLVFSSWTLGGGAG